MNAAAEFVDANIEAGRADVIAVRNATDDSTLTYGDVLRRVNRGGNALRDTGVQIEQRVMLLVPDCPEFIDIFFGAIKIGAVPVPVNTLLRAPDYEYLLRDSRTCCRWCTSRCTPPWSRCSRTHLTFGTWCTSAAMAEKFHRRRSTTALGTRPLQKSLIPSR